MRMELNSHVLPTIIHSVVTKRISESTNLIAKEAGDVKHDAS